MSLHTLSVSVHVSQMGTGGKVTKIDGYRKNIVEDSPHTPVDALSLEMWPLASKILTICSGHGMQGIIKVL